MEENCVVSLLLGCYYDGKEPGGCVRSKVAANAKGSELAGMTHQQFVMASLPIGG